MFRLYTLLFLCYLIAHPLHGQSIKMKEIYGIYEHSSCLPGRTIKKGNSSSSLSAMETYRSTISLKHCGRMTYIQWVPNTNKVLFKTKGKWWIEDNLIILSYQGKEEKFRFREPCYLESLSENFSYQKK